MLDAHEFLSLKLDQSVLRTDRFNMLYQGASNLFQLAVEFIDLRRRGDSSRRMLPNINRWRSILGLALHSHRLSC